MKPSIDMKKASIRASTDADLEAIHSWLVREDAAGVPDNFLCNWDAIENCHYGGRLTVFIDGTRGLPVAYQLGGLICPGILQVRSDMRRRGIGRKLVDYCVNQALMKDECILNIECEPASSVPFWRSMGFSLYNNGTGKRRAYRILRKAHRFPQNGEPVEATVKFFPEGRKWAKGENVPPLDSPTPKAVRTPDGVIHLSERIAVFKHLLPQEGDVFVEITVGRDRLYLDKAKYPKAAQLGVRRCSNGFYIDCIHPSTIISNCHPRR